MLPLNFRYLFQIPAKWFKDIDWFSRLYAGNGIRITKTLDGPCVSVDFNNPNFAQSERAEDLGCFKYVSGEDGSVLTNCYYQIGGFTYTMADWAVPNGFSGFVALKVSYSSLNSSGGNANLSATIQTYSTFGALQQAQGGYSDVVIPIYMMTAGKVSVDFRRIPLSGIIETYNALTM